MLVSDLIASARYELRDTYSTLYTDDELVEYVKKSLRHINRELAKYHFDYTYQDTDIVLLQGNDYATLPDDVLNVRNIYYNSFLLSKRDTDTLAAMRARNKVQNLTGRPVLYCLNNDKILFDKVADKDYSLFLIYDQKVPDVDKNSDMPYRGDFDDLVKQAVLVYAKNRNEYDINIDAQVHAMIADSIFSMSFARSASHGS